MKIERATAEAVRHVALNMRERDFAEFSAVSPIDTRERLAGYLSRAYGGREDVFAVYDGGAPVCIAGTIEAWPNVITLLFFATADFPKVVVPVTRFFRRLFDKYEAAGVHRIQAISIDDYEQTHQWLRLFGLKAETAPMLNYGRHGEAFIQFSRLKGGGATESSEHGRFSRTSDTPPLRQGGGA